MAGKGKRKTGPSGSFADYGKKEIGGTLIPPKTLDETNLTK